MDSVKFSPDTQLFYSAPLLRVVELGVRKVLCQSPGSGINNPDGEDDEIFGSVKYGQ